MKGIDQTTGAASYAQADAARALIDALVRPDDEELARAWEEACFLWGRYCEPYLGAVPVPFIRQGACRATAGGVGR